MNKNFISHFTNGNLHQRPKSLKRPLGTIDLRYTFIDVEGENGLGTFVFNITPIVIDSEIIKSKGIGFALDNLGTSEPVVLAAFSEEQLTAWVCALVQASALFMVENASRKNVPLLIQESIKNPRNFFTQSDINLLTARCIQSENPDAESHLEEPLNLTPEEQEQHVRSFLRFANDM